MNLLTSINNDHHYRLLQLTPELLEALEYGELVIKSTGNDLVGCTKSKAYQLKQINQSNTLLLVKPTTAAPSSSTREQTPVAGDSLIDQIDLSQNNEPLGPPDSILAFGSAANFLEPTELKQVSVVELSGSIPRYLGKGELKLPVNSSSKKSALLTRKELQMSAPMSDDQFDVEWGRLGGLEVSYQQKTIACLPTDEVVHSVLNDFLMAVAVEYSKTWQQMSLTDLLQVIPDNEQDGEPKNITESLMERFKNKEDKLDIDAISIFYGIIQLRKLNNKTSPIAEFKQRWTKSIPLILPTDLGISLLSGNYISPSETTIRYFSESDLSTNPKTRFKQLLSAKSIWELNDILPFIEPIRHNKAVKLENFIMKYAKRRKVGARTLVSDS